jgi:hypothetical protein
MKDFARSMKLALLATGSVILIQPAQAQTSSARQVPAPPPAKTSEKQQIGVAPDALVVQLPPGPIEFKNVSTGGGFPPWLATLIAGVFTTVATLVAVNWTNRQNAKNNQASLDAAARNAQGETNQRANELEIAALEKRLSGFFGPFLQLSEENKRLAQLLHARQRSPDFRTLTALLDPSWLKTASTTDQTLVEKIVENGIRLRDLIREEGGPAAPAVLSWLSKASAHFTVLQLAHEGKLVDDTEQFREYVYPRELDEVLKLECDRLDRRRNVLRGDLATRHGPIEELAIPAHLIPDLGS